MKTRILLSIIFSSLMLFIFSTPQVYSEMIHFPEQILDELLQGENKNDFLINEKGTNFASNFNDENGLRDFGNDILIQEGTEVIIDGRKSLEEFSTILIEGTLTIDVEKDSFLKAQRIIVGPKGRLIIGTSENPIKEIFEIIFVKNQPGETGIFVLGELTIHGQEVSPTFTTLISDTKIGDTTITIGEVPKNWQTGNRIVLTTPGFQYDEGCHIEESEILRIQGVFIDLQNPLNCPHIGTIKPDEYGYYPKSHVSLLDRNVIIRSDDLDNRGSLNFFYGSTGSIKYVELRDLGPKGTLARYPIHFHHMGDSSRGIEVIGNSIINSDNRWITVHDSNGIFIKNNVGYKSTGHGFFLEDGLEFENVFENNIGIITRPGDLIESDSRASIFWIKNPYNYFINNVAVAGFYYGYYFSVPNLWTKIPTTGEEINIQSLPTLKFDNNQSYDTRHAGIKIERLINDQNTFNIKNYIISNFTVWNVGEKKPELINSGILIEADNIIVTDSKIYDSPVGITPGMEIIIKS